MKRILVCIALAAGALATPVLGFAQSAPGALTRAEVRADLARVEHAGYNPSRADDADYPADIQAAEAKIAAEDVSQRTNDAVGGVSPAGHSASGAPVNMAKHETCVGPVSFCTPFFGS